jgi:hypothetical protein
MKHTLTALHFLFAFLLPGLNSYSRSEPLPVFPGPIEDPQFIYHPPTKSMLLVGGNPVVQDSVESPVWKWDGQWSKIEAKGPGARVFFQGALNTKTNNIESFAGAGLARVNPLLDDLWSFDGKQWQRIKNNDIGPRDHHKMVYADHLNGYVLYGGGINHVFDTTTWLMRDGKFTALHISSPGIRYQFGMVYDKRRKKVVLYGGGEKPGEQWEFDGKRWEKIVTAVNPGTRSYHFMAYDENLEAVVLHGGSVNNHPQDPVNLATPTTWLWDGIAWKKIAEANIFPLAIGYNPLRKSIMAYGYNDGSARNSRHLQLWELKDYKWTQLDDYGEWNTINYLEQQLKQNPGNAMVLLSYAQELKNAKRLTEAEIAFRKLEPVNLPNKSSVWFGLIDVLKDEGKLDEAQNYLFKAEQLQLIPENRRMARLYYNLACAFALKNDTDKAFESLHKAAGFGYDNKKDYESDTDLVSLRTDDRWNELMKKLK